MATKTVRGPQGNMVLIGESREEPAKPTSKKPAVPVSGEVRLFEAVRDTYLALAEWRIALVLGKKSLQEKAATLRAQLDLLETRAFQSNAHVMFCMAIRKAAANLHLLSCEQSGDPTAVSQASRELLDAMGYLERRAPRTDEELRAKALATHARICGDDDLDKFGIR
jgi:hypothetical protein